METNTLSSLSKVGSIRELAQVNLRPESSYSFKSRLFITALNTDGHIFILLMLKSPPNIRGKDFDNIELIRLKSIAYALVEQLHKPLLSSIGNHPLYFSCEILYNIHLVR